jgi:hypothetical protein
MLVSQPVVLVEVPAIFTILMQRSHFEFERVPTREAIMPFVSKTSYVIRVVSKLEKGIIPDVARFA